MEPASAPTQIQSNQPVTDSPKDNLYNSSVGSIFWKNFVAGFARALGGLIIWIFLLILSGFFFVNQVWPRLHPLISSYQQLVETFINSPGNTAPQLR